MKRYLKTALRFILFCVIFMVILMLLSKVFVPKDNQKSAGMEAVQSNGILGEPDNTMDYLVVGDSETYSSITPMEIWRQYGYAGYVCGTGGQHLYDTERFLAQALKKQSPKYVILETNALYRKIAYEKILKSQLEKYFQIFRYHDRWKSLMLNDFTGSVNYTWTNDYKGYRYENKVATAALKDYMKQTDQKAKISAINQYYVEQMIKLCRKNNVELILISTPSIKNWNYAKHNGIQALADQYGLEYYDLNLMPDQVKIDWKKDTRDKGDHLNHTGAVQVSDWLGAFFHSKNTLTAVRRRHTVDGMMHWEDMISKLLMEQHMRYLMARNNRRGRLFAG